VICVTQSTSAKALARLHAGRGSRCQMGEHRSLNLLLGTVTTHEQLESSGIRGTAVNVLNHHESWREQRWWLAGVEGRCSKQPWASWSRS
jgi:hypothetical protein